MIFTSGHKVLLRVLLTLRESRRTVRNARIHRNANIPGTLAGWLSWHAKHRLRFIGESRAVRRLRP